DRIGCTIPLQIPDWLFQHLVLDLFWQLRVSCTCLQSLEAAMPINPVLRKSTRLASFAATLFALAFAAGDALAQQPPYRERPSAYDRNSESGRSERRDQAGTF